MKKVQLERILQSLDAVPSPKAGIEQYPTPAGIAAEVAFIAFGRGDIEGRRVLDAGCGNGILGIAAKLLGADQVVGVDLDPAAVQTAERNGRRANVDVEWHLGEIAEVTESYDTVLMNPPFGSQTKHADLPFLEKALSGAHTVYSFHNAATEQFVVRRIESRGATVTDVLRYSFPIGRMFPFHRDDQRRIPVILVRTETAVGE